MSTQDSKRSPITTHILDLSQGKPASQVPVSLEIQNGASWKEIGHETTNSDGRIENLLPAGHSLTPGVYRLQFATAIYFQSMKLKSFYPTITVTFEVIDTKQHYHVPLLLSPFGYSTYRGS